MNPRPLFLISLLVSAAAASAHGQVPPRRLYYGSTGQAVPAAGGAAAATNDPQREADLRDGTVLPRGVRSLRIEREGEVIRQRPHVESPRRGTAARGARLPALEATQGHGCRGYWVRVGEEAWVCSDGGLTLSTDAPQTQQLPHVPEGQVVPYQYAFATRAGVRTYRRLDDIREDNWAEELERGMSVAVTGTEHIDEGTYVRTASARWVALRDLSWARPSERAGIFYEPGETIASVAFLRADARAWPTVEEAARQRGAAVGTSVLLARRDAIHIREAQTFRGRQYVRVDAGWLSAHLIQRPEVPAAPATLRPDERWLDVDRARQVLVAFEGERPVFATLVSTGRPGNPTAPGEHHVWVKLATTDMSNVDNVDLYSATSLYTVSRVPWVMFFHNDQALHGAFWHDRFGAAHSHGCVNLAPRDAAWLYSWAPPVAPPGWTAVMPTARDPGLRVRVR
jgi:lipoprotein-anchoring transpeptidase ErfK/SrfK